VKKFLTLGIASALFASPAAAMDVATFLRYADALERMGVRAPFASEGPLVMNELNDSNRALRAERVAAQAAGRRPGYCPETHARAGPQEVVAALRRIPPARRPGIEVRDALRAFYARRYPCPA
jgi:hypothetical protein